MSKNTELAVVNNYTALKDFNLADAIMSELNGMSISFDHVSIPAAGGLAFELPGELPGETDMAKEFKGVIGLPIPDKLREILEQLHNREDKTDKTDNE